MNYYVKLTVGKHFRETCSPFKWYPLFSLIDLSFSDIGCTNRAKGSDRTWSSIATFGDDIKNRQRGEKYSNTILERLLNRQ